MHGTGCFSNIFSSWNIVFCSFIIISAVVLVADGLVWDILENFLVVHCCGSRSWDGHFGQSRHRMVTKCAIFGNHDTLAWSSQVSADEHICIKCVYCLVWLVVFLSVSVVIFGLYRVDLCFAVEYF
jgi:hypothetical protein